MANKGPLSCDQTRQCMCWEVPANTECLYNNNIDIVSQDPVAKYGTLEKVLELDQKLSTLHSAMMDCRTCSSDPMRTMTLLHELDLLCTLYVAGQAKFATSSDNNNNDNNNDNNNNSNNGERAQLGHSTFQLGHFVLDNEECKVVGRIVVRQGLDDLQRKLQVMQVEQIRDDDSPIQTEIRVKVQTILSRVWEAFAYGCL